MLKKSSQSMVLDNLDCQMRVVRDFIDEFYNKTIFKDGKRSGRDLAPSIIKSLFAFDDPNGVYPIGILGQNAQVKRSTMTDMVDRMERDGIVERVRDGSDRRLVKVLLTAKGKRIRREFHKKRRQEFQALFSQLQPEEAARFIRHLDEACKILKKIN